MSRADAAILEGRAAVPLRQDAQQRVPPTMIEHPACDLTVAATSK